MCVFLVWALCAAATGSSCRMMGNACFLSCWPDVCYLKYVRHAWFFRDLMGIWASFHPYGWNKWIIYLGFLSFCVIKEEATKRVGSGTLKSVVMSAGVLPMIHRTWTNYTYKLTFCRWGLQLFCCWRDCHSCDDSRKKWHTNTHDEEHWVTRSQKIQTDTEPLVKIATKWLCLYSMMTPPLPCVTVCECIWFSFRSVFVLWGRQRGDHWDRQTVQCWRAFFSFCNHQLSNLGSTSIIFWWNVFVCLNNNQVKMQKWMTYVLYKRKMLFKRKWSVSSCVEPIMRFCLGFMFYFQVPEFLFSPFYIC